MSVMGSSLFKTNALSSKWLESQELSVHHHLTSKQCLKRRGGPMQDSRVEFAILGSQQHARPPFPCRKDHTPLTRSCFQRSMDSTHGC